MPLPPVPQGFEIVNGLLAAVDRLHAKRAAAAAKEKSSNGKGEKGR